MSETVVKIKLSIIQDTISAVKTVLNMSGTAVKPSQLPNLIRTIPRYTLENYTNSDNVTNANLQTLIQGVKQDTQDILDSLEFTDSEDTDDIIDDITGGS